MHTVKSELQSVLTKTYLIAGRPRLCISMISAFSLASPDRLLDESEPWGAAADRVDDVAPFDQFMPKAQGEYLVGGSAYAPKGRESSGFEIAVRVGSLTKKITVLGDRYWGASGLTNPSTGNPRPFTRMPLTYARAFGGPDYPDNPAGTGYAPVSSQAEGLKLPNFQYPGRPVASPREMAPPASLGPVSLSARGRTRYLGTYGSKWQTDHWPGWPADLKSEYFNAAAPDQWLEDFFKGDEPLLVQNLHPEYERIESSLPGYRTRCFVTKEQKSGQITEEARVRLDTLWLFPDAMMGALIWRADIPVTDEEASNVVEIMAVPEPLSAPLRTAEEYRTMLAGESAEETPKAEPPAYDSGDGPTAPATEPQPPPPDFSAQAELLAEMEAAVRKTEKSYVDSLAALGLDVNQIPPAKGLSLEQVEPPVQPLAFDPDIAKRDLEEAESALDLMVQSLNPEQVQPPPSEVMTRFLQQSPEETAEFLAQAASDEVNPEAYLALAREASLESDKLERLLAGEKSREKAIPPTAPEVEEQSEDLGEFREPWTRDRLLDAHGRGESLAGIDISGLDLTGVDLSGADMTGTTAAETNFTQADLTGVKLTEAVLTGANLTECRLIKADLSRSALDRVGGPRADFTKAVLTEADLSQSDLSQARFHDAALTAALLQQSRLDQAEFHGAVLAGADFSGASLIKALFYQVKGTGAVFDRASMTEAEFHQSQLNDPSFDQTRAERLKVSESSLIGLRGGAETSFQNSCFQEVDLSGAVWDGADLKGSNFRGAELNRADFSGCRLQKCDFYRARAREAKFTAADLTEASMISINLFRGDLSKADLTRTSLKGANLYEVEFRRAKMTDTTLTGSNLARTKLEGWHP